MLGKYLDAWYPIIASWNGRLVFLDGFAGRGRYTDGSEGSPLIALRRLLDHRFWPRMSDREFVFIFVERDEQNADSLRAEIDAFKAQRQPWPANVQTEVVHGTFDRTATEILEQLRAQKANLAPTFAFVDPFGYSGLPMALLAELLAYPRTELFVTFMVGYVQRFIARDGQQRVMRELFGIDVDEVLETWDPANVGRVEHFRAVYERQLKEVVGFDYVGSFGMVNETGNVEYYLLHGTRHPKGVRKMKAAMWSVDPGGGYRFFDRTAGVDVLFEATPDLGPLRAAMVDKYKGRAGISISEVEWFAVLETSYRETHVRSVLKPLEAEGVITVHRPGRRDYPNGTTIDFA
jgi:three-Cys-motif partner protein